jgi:regulator of cell morphogenesis and NO signaling
MRLDPATPIAHVVARRPLGWAVLRRHGVDGSTGTLDDACAGAGKDVAIVIAEIEAAEGRFDGDLPSHDIDGLIDRADAYHRGLDDELARLRALARVAGAGAIHAEIDRLAEDLTLHREKEQRILFPWLRSGRGATAVAPVLAMELEHDETMCHLRELRRLCRDYRVPARAGPSVAALWRGLERLEDDLVRHIHTENNLLFPLALAR